MRNAWRPPRPNSSLCRKLRKMRVLTDSRSEPKIPTRRRDGAKIVQTPDFDNSAKGRDCNGDRRVCELLDEAQCNRGRRGHWCGGSRISTSTCGGEFTLSRFITK